MEVDLGRLTASIQRSRQVLRRYREERREMVSQYVGTHWAEEGAKKKIPINLLSLYVSVVGRNLVAKNPRVLLSTFKREHKAMVSAMQSWANREIESMSLAETMQRIVLDSLFSSGISKVALAGPADSALTGWNTKAGDPFAERIDLDDFVYDVHARDMVESSYMGHRYRAPIDVIKDSKIYSKARKKLEPSRDNPYNLEGDERISTLGRGLYAGDDEEFEDYVDLWEIYLPRHRLVLTLADNDLSGPSASEALREQRWIGRNKGPYHILSYGVVPGNAMGKGPLQDLMDLHELVNRLYRKLARQAERQKDLMVVQGGAMEDGSRIQEADDGEIIRVDNPERTRPMSLGGPHQANMAMAIHAKDLFGYMAGNLDMMGGLSPQSKTVGQDQILAQNASRAIADMQDRTITYVSEVLKSLCWYWWQNPFKVMRTTHSLPGIPEISIERQVKPEQRLAVPFEDLEIRIDPYSLQHSTPQIKLANLNQVVQQIILPALPLLQRQGIGLDINAYLQKVAAYADMPDLADILTIQEPPQEETKSMGPPENEAPGMPANTTRTYLRENMPGRTRQGNDMHLMNTLLGASGGEDEKAMSNASNGKMG